MRYRAFGRFTALVTAFLFILLSVIPSTVTTNAAPAEELVLSVNYNAATHLYDVSFPAGAKPGKVTVSWHQPDGTVFSVTNTNCTFGSGKVTLGFNYLPDYIYDISVQAFANQTDIDPYGSGTVYYLAGITFTGESFNVMAKMSDIEDNAPELDGTPGSAITAQSGNHPKIRLRWKVPKIYYDPDPADGVAGTVVDVTKRTGNGFLASLSETGADITKVGFQVSMNKGKSSTTTLNFNTAYVRNTATNKDDMILEGGDYKDASNNTVHHYIGGVDDGTVTAADGFITLNIDDTNGIEPGTEYEYTNIGVIFENDSGEQIPLRTSHLRTDSNNHFTVTNIDNAFSDYGSNITSIFTPLQFEITKVDVDKVQVIFKRITNGVYPELYYQVQYASRIDDLYTQTDTWVKIPDSTLASGEQYGSEIVTINVPGTTNPEYYFRVVFFDSSSAEPKSSSLCLNLQLLGIDSGKPPLPREIQVEPIYAGRETVTVPHFAPGGLGDVEIPVSDLRISFEKPLIWKLIPNWSAYSGAPYDYANPGPNDYTFHVLLSTYLPETAASPETKVIGLGQTQTVYLPVKQKRMLVIGKQQLSEDPDDPNRLVCTIPGDQLFWDYSASPGPSGSAISAENNENPDGNASIGDYPGFLIPNTTYYMQIFTSRLEDNAAITSDVWGDSTGLPADLNGKLSFVSPVSSFTTWPLNELPVPIPNIQPEPLTSVDAATGSITLSGIRVSYQRVMTETDWQRYTDVGPGVPREIHYEMYISKDASDESSFKLVGTDIRQYPADADLTNLSYNVTNSGIQLPDGSYEPIKPNTVYYLKARASLYVDGDLIGSSVFTPVKAITTPKIDSGGLDNTNRDPRAPSEFNIKTDSQGEQLLSDASATFSWVHAESDVDYEMVCTENAIKPDADPANPDEGIYGDTYNTDFLDAYRDFVVPAGDLTVTIHPDNNNALLRAEKFVLDGNGGITLPITRPLLRPNRTYFFSLRAVRNKNKTDAQGHSIETVSRWVTVPVTTKMVQAPAYLEAVRDLEIGFNVVCTQTGSNADSMEVYMKKATAPESSYAKLNRSQYSAVKDGTTYYFRIYNLEANTLYNFKLYNKVSSTWYANSSGTWDATAGSITMKTRDTLHEIEVRWEGQEPYEYFLEALGENETEYQTLSGHTTEHTNYNYALPGGTWITFYREKTSLFVQESSPKYIYYAKIIGKPVKDSDGIVNDMALKTNTLYSLKLWAVNHEEESLHVGPVSVRTDFSQEDYDDQKKTDNVVDVYNLQAEELTKKLYWLIDRTGTTVLRALVKGDMVSGLLQASPGSTVTLDLSAELQDPSSYDILIPQSVLETIERNDSSLNIKLQGAEMTLNRGSIDLEGLKRQSLINGAKEAMLRLRVERSGSVKKPLPAGFKAISKDYALDASAIGSRRTYAEINSMIYAILKDSSATGPFRYGIFDRELTKVLQQIENYSYRSHSELSDMIASIIDGIETELSRYLKDIIDGGSGLPSDFAVNKPVTSFPGRIGFKMEYLNQAGYIAPFANYSAAPGWKEPSGAKGYVYQYVLFRAEGPGEYVVVVSGSVTTGTGGSDNGAILKLGGKYDLSKVFGKATLYPANPVTGQQAVMLYAVVSERDGELTGLTPAQTVSKLGIGDIIGARDFSGYIDNQHSLSLSVKLYCEKAGIPVAMLKPTRTVMISNASQINSRLYQFVVLGIDLGFAKTNNSRFDATGRSSAGQVLDMVSKVLEKLGE